ncbi:MAG: DUF1016 N-terminal domain-containing protein [bacterium]|nr:DUF1016 N-terminal domain-containing protein [bacterium]
MTTKLAVSSYQKLIFDLTSILEKGHQTAVHVINQIRLNTYWEMGKRLAKAKELADASESDTFFKRLAGDLKMDPALLYRIRQFYRLWPKGVPSMDQAAVLSWSHMVELLSIPSAKERQFYLKEASVNDWSRDKLRKAIEKNLFETKRLPGRKTEPALTRPINPLHVYKAVVERVVDGDTLLVRIDLGFDVWVTQRTRFRGINTAETSSTPFRAEKATLFVSEKLQGLKFVVLKTYKTDQFGRYVVDLFYHPTLSQKEAVYEQGFFLNSDLLDKKLADLYSY